MCVCVCVCVYVCVCVCVILLLISNGCTLLNIRKIRSVLSWMQLTLCNSVDRKIELTKILHNGVFFHNSRYCSFL